jgi:hypothetical protein
MRSRRRRRRRAPSGPRRNRRRAPPGRRPHGDAGGVARERAHGRRPARGGDELGADGAAGASDEHLHDRPGYGRRGEGAHYPGRRGALRPAIVAGIVGLASARAARAPSGYCASRVDAAEVGTGQTGRNPGSSTPASTASQVAEGAPVRGGAPSTPLRRRGIAVTLRQGHHRAARGELAAWTSSAAAAGQRGARAAPRAEEISELSPIAPASPACTRPTRGSSTSRRGALRWPTCAPPAASGPRAR